MIKCGKCGSKCSPTDILCGSCGASKQEFIRESVQTNTQAASSTINKTVSAKNNLNLKLSEQEVIIKSYNAATMKGQFSSPVDGYITVTNKRVIFQSTGEKTFYRSEVPVEEVSGTRVYHGTGWNILCLFRAAITAIIGLYIGYIILNSYYGTTSTLDTIVFIMFALTAYFGYISYNQSYNISIFSKGATSSPISVGDNTFGAGLTGQGAALTITAVPSKDTMVMIEELGALILDIKSLGNHAIDKWTNNEEKKIKEKNYVCNTNKVNNDEFSFD